MNSSDNSRQKTQSEVVVRFFGPLEEALGKAEGVIRLEYPQTEATLRNQLLIAFPSLKGRVFAIAVDQAILGEGDSVISAGEIALLPPFAGG